LSLEELRRAVLEKAILEAEEIVKDAQKRAESIIKEAEEKKRTILEEERKRVLSELGLEARLGEARREASLILARTKHEIVEELKKRAEELINTMSMEERKESLRRLLQESLEEMKKCGFDLTGVIVSVSPRDRKLIEDLLEEMNLTVTVVEDERITGGIIVSTPGGEIYVDNTYETRLERALRRVLPELFRAD